MPELMTLSKKVSGTLVALGEQSHICTLPCLRNTSFSPHPFPVSVVRGMAGGMCLGGGLPRLPLDGGRQNKENELPHLEDLDEEIRPAVARKTAMLRTLTAASPPCVGDRPPVCFTHVGIRNDV